MDTTITSQHSNSGRRTWQPGFAQPFVFNAADNVLNGSVNTERDAQSVQGGGSIEEQARNAVRQLFPDHDGVFVGAQGRDPFGEHPMQEQDSNNELRRIQRRIGQFGAAAAGGGRLDDGVTVASGGMASGGSLDGSEPNPAASTDGSLVLQDTDMTAMNDGNTADPNDDFEQAYRTPPPMSPITPPTTGAAYDLGWGRNDLAEQ